MGFVFNNTPENIQVMVNLKLASKVGLLGNKEDLYQSLVKFNFKDFAEVIKNMTAQDYQDFIKYIRNW